MGRFTKQVVAGLTATLVLAGGAAAQVSSLLDNFEGGTAQNRWGEYWYFYDDQNETTMITGQPASRGGSQVHSAEVRGTGDDREVLFTEKSLTQENPRGNNSAVLDFTFGPSFDMRWGSNAETCAAAGGGCYPFQQFVGIGTNLIYDGSNTAPAGFQNATKVRFWARANEPLTIAFMAQQSHVQGNADWQKLIDITPGWAEYEVELNDTDMSQPGWAEDNDVVTDFRLTNTVKFAWQIQAQSGDDASYALNPLPGDALNWSRTFVLDDIWVDGFNYVAPDMCMECITTSKPTNATVQLSRFDVDAADMPTQNTLGWYWYAYDDKETTVDAGTSGGTSQITDGVDPDSEYATGGAGELLINPDEGAPLIQFTMGGTMRINGHTVQPFVGLGTDLYETDDNGDPVGEFYDATALNGIYFRYITGQEIDYIYLEIQDDLDVTGARPESAVRYIRLPGTDGEWSAANVPFSRMRLHLGWEDVDEWYATAPADHRNLRFASLAKIQFKFQGLANGSSWMGIDDVAFTTGANNNVRHVTSRANAAGLRATYNRGVVGVNWTAASTVASGKISLINTRGRVISSAPIANVSGNRITANLGSGTIPTGMYFVRIDARDMNGKRVTQQVPVSIVK